MSEVWSSGVWIVKPGKADEFIAAWTEFAEWSSATYGGTMAWLLRRRDRPEEFLSIGPWPDDETIAAWRADPEFGARISRVRELLDGFEPRTFDPAAAIGAKVS